MIKTEKKGKTACRWVLFGAFILFFCITVGFAVYSGYKDPIVYNSFEDVECTFYKTVSDLQVGSKNQQTQFIGSNGMINFIQTMMDEISKIKGQVNVLEIIQYTQMAGKFSNNYLTDSVKPIIKTYNNTKISSPNPISKQQITPSSLNSKMHKFETSWNQESTEIEKFAKAISESFTTSQSMGMILSKDKKDKELKSMLPDQVKSLSKEYIQSVLDEVKHMGDKIDKKAQELNLFTKDRFSSTTFSILGWVFIGLICFCFIVYVIAFVCTNICRKGVKCGVMIQTSVIITMSVQTFQVLLMSTTLVLGTYIGGVGCVMSFDVLKDQNNLKQQLDFSHVSDEVKGLIDTCVYYDAEKNKNPNLQQAFGKDMGIERMFQIYPLLITYKDKGFKERQNIDGSVAIKNYITELESNKKDLNQDFVFDRKEDLPDYMLDKQKTQAQKEAKSKDAFAYTKEQCPKDYIIGKESDGVSINIGTNYCIVLNEMTSKHVMQRYKDNKLIKGATNLHFFEKDYIRSKKMGDMLLKNYAEIKKYLQTNDPTKQGSIKSNSSLLSNLVPSNTQNDKKKKDKKKKESGTDFAIEKG